MCDTQTTVVALPILGKRKRQSNFVLQLSGGSESGGDNISDSPASPVASSSTTRLARVPIIINGKVVFEEKRRYACTFEGCAKSYTKPCRLEEHERTHTGERPFVCSTCGKNYLRDSHLQAHFRSHLPDTARSFVCPQEGCDKKFWTIQHLNRHELLHLGEKPFKCSEAGCDMAFSKHHQLRTHVAGSHCPVGTKPYRCDHGECTKSFVTAQKLKAHSRTHQERRYTCSDPTCEIIYFSTWTALQAHTRTAHPATCPYPSCNGKTFSQQKGLRAHLKIHEQKEVEESLMASIRNMDTDADDESEKRPVKRRRGGEVGRDWKCTVEGCAKDFKSKKALGIHHKVTHLQRRDWLCDFEGCGASFGYKHLLQRHAIRAHSNAEDMRTGQNPIILDSATKPNAIDILTGVAYADRSQVLTNRKLHSCPFRSFSTLAEDAIDCNFAFSRAYDLKRHLKSAHDIDISREDADRWVRNTRA